MSSACLPLSANSEDTVSPTVQPCLSAADLDTTTPSLPRSEIEPAETSRFMTCSAEAGSTEEYVEGAPSNRASPNPLAETESTPSTPSTAVTTDGLKPGAVVLEGATNRSALVCSEMTSPNDAFSEEAKTPMLTTRARPIISAAAVADVRRGFRVAFCLASSPGRPRSRSGAPIAAASGRTTTGSAVITPTSAASRPSPNTFMLAPPYNPSTMPATPAAVRRTPMTVRRTEGRSAPGVDSRSASTGSTLVARRAGTRAATTVTTVPTSTGSQTERGSICSAVNGSASPTASMRSLSPLATTTPRPTPMADAVTPRTSASTRRLVMTCRRRAPIARSSAISRERWVTVIVKVFQMMNEPTNSAMPAKAPNTMPTIWKLAFVASEFSFTTVAPVTASAPWGTTAESRWASSVWETPGSALTSMESYWSGEPRTRCAVAPSKYAEVVPPRSLTPSP